MLLDPDEPASAVGEALGAAGRFLFVCDHAGRAVPRRLGRLGLPDAAFETHIASDIGALDLARRLAERLDSPLVWQRWSRLVIDCNRAPGHPQSIVAVSDGQTIPGNRSLAAAEAEARRAEVFAPYHAAIAAELDARAARGAPTLLVLIHSFTPRMAGADRPWHVGVLHLGDSPASFALLAALRGEPGLTVGDNQPYAMDGTDYTAPHHRRGRAIDYVEIETRQDLLQDPAWTARLTDLFARLLPALARS